MTEIRQDPRQPFARGWPARQAEADQPRVPAEAPRPDPLPGQSCVGIGARDPGQTEQGRAAHHHETVAQQHPVERLGFLDEAMAHGLGPIRVGQGRGCDLDGRACDRPGAERLAQWRDQGLRPDGEAEPEPGKTIEFSEGSQGDNRQILQQAGDRGLRHRVDEGLVDDEPALPFSKCACDGQGVALCDRPAIRVVGMDQDRMADPLVQRPARAKGLRIIAGLLPGAGMLGIGRLGDADGSPSGRQTGQPLDQSLRSRRGHDVMRVRHAIGDAGGRNQRLEFVPARQGGPEMGAQRPERIGKRRDAGGKVKPFLPPPAKPGHRLAEIAAMLHDPAMAWKWLARQCSLVTLAIFLAAPALAQAVPSRIVSINMCTDQLLLDLARPEQIAGLSPFGADPLRSWAAEKAKPFRRLSGGAEEVLVLAPDLVVGGRFTRRTTREFIRQQGFRLEEFDAVRSIAETRAQILRMGALVGNRAGAERRVAEIDAALGRLRAAVSPLKLRVLPVARRGWVSGSQSLVTDLLAQAGLVNVAGELGFRQGGFASLESLVVLNPDAILVARDDLTPEDQGTAKLLHPALAGRFAAERKLTMPEKLTVCGGPMLVEAIDHLGRELVRIGRP